MKGFHFFCQWPAVIWIKHWFYPKFSRCVRDDSLPPRKPRARLITEERWKWRGWGDEDERQRRESKTGARRRHWNARRETDGTRGAEENTGGMRRENRGFGRQQLREEKKKRKKDSVVDERGLTQNWKGKEGFFFFLKCSVQISLYFHSLSNTCHSSSL